MRMILVLLAAALAQAPLHDAQYPDADISYGATLYASKCVTCHGALGDGIGGVNLRSGTFRNAVIDRDLERFIRAGSPAGMPAFALDNAEMAGIGASRSRVAPDLSEIGSARSAGSLQRSLLDPNSQMMPINRPVRLVKKDGSIINGRRLNEDTYSVQIIDDHERLQSLQKSDIRELTISTTSPMPSYKSTLSEGEIADVLAY